MLTVMAGILLLLPVVAAAPNRPPVVRALCNPCSVAIGKTSTVTAEARDPEGKKLTYTWNAPAGAIGKASDRETTWTAPSVEGPVPVSVRVADAKGAIASDVVIIQVTK